VASHGQRAAETAGADAARAGRTSDLTGVWNGLGDNLNGVPNQLANNGIVIESETAAHDLHSGQVITVLPRNTNRAQNNEEAERAAALLRRSGSNRPVYKPEYWDMVKYNDHNANEEDPSNNCMPAGVPRGGIPSYIGQSPTYMMFIYPGQGGLIATQTMYRMIRPTAEAHTIAGPGRHVYGREHWPLGGRYVRRGLMGVQREYLVRPDWRLHARLEHACERTLSPRRKHA
jgi:hypothetical protein